MNDCVRPDHGEGVVQDFDHDDTPYTCHGSGNSEVGVAFPVPGSPALLQVVKPAGTSLDLWSVPEPGSPFGDFLYSAPEQGEEGSLLVHDTGPGALRMLKVVSDGSWTLQLKEPGAARELVDTLAGHGCEVVRYDGPGCVATLVADVHGAGGNARIRVLPESGVAAFAMDPADSSAEQADDSAEVAFLGAGRYAITLDGPRLVVVLTRDDWQLSTEEAGPDESGPPAGPPAHRGMGSRTVGVTLPDPDEPAVLEVLAFANLCVNVPEWPLRENVFHTYEVGPGYPTRYLLVPKPRRGAPVEIELEARDAEWELRVVPLAGAQRLGSRHTGLGSDVLRYDGPPARLVLHEPTGRPTIRRWARNPLGEWSCTRLSGAVGDMTSVIGVGLEPDTISVSEQGSWVISALPVEHIRDFDRSLTGRGPELVRYTGPDATLDVRAGAVRAARVIVGIPALELNRAGRDAVAARSSLRKAGEPVRFEVAAGFLTVTAAEGQSWRIEAHPR
ncbi:hypothetical protein [Embleya sp. NPDC020886]|uniref:hypothetical protein n=1 Tax=Embleya sp. NPDC020886 TaxID=3363980 RepID=UPI0037ACB009